MMPLNIGNNVFAWLICYFQATMFSVLILSKVGQCAPTLTLDNNNMNITAPMLPSAIINLSLPVAVQDRKTFTARVPIHILPSNQIIEYFEWEIDVGLRVCPFPGMLVRARRGGPLSLLGEETLDDLADLPSPHCSVECECMATGDYRCRSLCTPPPTDMDYCVPVRIPGECCHRYVCDDDLDKTFPAMRFPELPHISASNVNAVLLCTPGTVLPDSVCHFFFPKAFDGNRGPKGICFGFDDIRCIFLDENNTILSTSKNDSFLTVDKMARISHEVQTIFFQTAVNSTIFSTDVPLKRAKTAQSL